jgi:type IV pilus assembly protein PilA
MKKYNKGFTLIELLVVIAIIGILSSVVLSSLNSAREKGKNAAAKSELASVRSQANLYYDDNNQSYGVDSDTLCSSAGLNMFNSTEPNNVTTLVTAAETRIGTNAVCANSSSAYVVAITLIGGENWCVDSTGYSGTTTLALGDPGVQANIACQ